MTANPSAQGLDLEHLVALLRGYMRLPFAGRMLPGRYVETAVARIKDGTVLPTYDFVDVVNIGERIGWQVKSTMQSTPVTWKRAKIPNALALIDQSRVSATGIQALGDAIIAFCNEHAVESLQRYDLDRIGYCRVLLREDSVLYFERELITRERPVLFDPAEFTWRWSVAKKTQGKEQLSALHGHHQKSGRKWFAAHILGENQLHFSGEPAWWPHPQDGTPQATFTYPSKSEVISFDDLISWLDEPRSSVG